MANHCYNFIEINGSEEEIKDFAKLLELNDTQENGCDVYTNLLTEFCDGEIGENAKWFDLESDQIEGDNQYLKISGDSAWCPSLDLFTAISEKYPSFKIRYEYEEMGCDFSGWAEIENGEAQDNFFAYWEGQVAMDPSNALDNAIGNELSCYDTEAELLESDMFKAFSTEAQIEILENYKR
jgi:hypothetical protein